MSRELSSFAFPPTLRVQLIRAGFRTVGDLAGMKAIDLAKEASISPTDALSVLQTIRPKTSDSKLLTAPKSALELLQNTEKMPHIITFCGEIDSMLGGGIALGEVTEFCGVPGIGKTQLGIQLAVDVHLPHTFGGAQGHAVYVDTEGSFMPERSAEIADAFVAHVKKMARYRNEASMLEAAANLSVDSILENIHFFRVHDYIEQITVINTLSMFLEQNPTVKLVVIDSVAFHFRHDFEDFAARSRIMAGMANTLTQIAKTKNVAVVLINQVTTKVGGGTAYLAPALGESWSHLCSNRVILYWENGQRFAKLVKSTTFRCETVPYQITADGVRGYPRKRSRPEPARELDS